MKKISLYFLVVAVAIALFIGCKKKVNGINNNTVIETPYALYFSDTAGQVYYSNDGHNKKQIFSPDGFPCHALIVSGNNILFAKSNLYISSNNGVNFNHSYDSLRFKPDTAVDGLLIDLNQSMIADAVGSNEVMYTTTRLPHVVGASPNYLGVTFNNNHGIRGFWSVDNGYDTSQVGVMPVKMFSFNLLPNGTLAGLALDPNGVSIRNFYLSDPTNIYGNWVECTGSHLGNYHDTTGSPLPPNYTISDKCEFRLGHYNNRLIAIDMSGKQAAWYSDDIGRNWHKYSGLPANTPLLCIGSPFEQVALIGTHGKGLYVLNTNSDAWTQNNNGLGTNITVRNVIAKENTYKNGTKVQFVYLATDQGIYQSTDGGIHWTMTIPGNYVTVY